MKKAVLLLGFGGPAAASEVRPFLESVLEGVRVPPARFEEVLRHYDAVGGVSPYNESAFRQKAALESWLAAEGRALPVFLGFRHSFPSFREAFSALAASGASEAAAFVFSPLRSAASYGKYVALAASARDAAGASSVAVRYAAPFHDDPLFIEAQADRLRETLAALRPARALAIFSAHSVPQAVSDESGYDAQFRKVAGLTAAAAGCADWTVAYQSRSGRPEDPWLSPDVRDAVRAADRRRFDAVALVPAGFLCENVEILYDLDVEARAAAEESGLVYARSGTVFGHPSFTALMGRRVLEAL